MKNIRNFLITAHIDHGKSTLADRLLEETKTVEKRQMHAQYLDSMELERERGITIKMAPVRMIYKYHSDRGSSRRSELNADPRADLRNGLASRSAQIQDEYILNLIDTPGHSDFSYEVSRALAAVEGAILLVDATQGIQAQTLYNFEMAKKAGLKIIGVVNKIDIADEQRIKSSIRELASLIGADENEIIRASGKTGQGIPEILKAIVERIPPPRSYPSPRQSASILRESASASRALVFDSFYDDHKGVVAYVRVFNGSFKVNQSHYLIAANEETKTKEIGYFKPALISALELKEGEIGYIATGIKDPDVLKIGDTLISVDQRFDPRQSASLALPGYKEPNPVVFVSFYPEHSDDYDDLKKALAKLRLSDSSMQFEPDTSEVLGRGFKGGFLGRLHYEIFTERVRREFGIEIVSTFPSVAYRIKSDTRRRGLTRTDTPINAEKIQRESASSQRDSAGFVTITNPRDFPDEASEVLEPVTKVEILTPLQYLGSILQLKNIYRLSNINTKPVGVSSEKMLITAELPLADLISDFDDKLKSVSQGYGSLNYEITGYKPGDLDKLEILVAEQVVPGLTRILPKADIYHEGRLTCEKLKKLLPKVQFIQAIQARHRGRIIARETIPAVKKTLGYFGKTGGDRTRKMKLWKKQARGKERLQERGVKSGVAISASVFKELLRK